MMKKVRSVCARVRVYFTSIFYFNFILKRNKMWLNHSVCHVGILISIASMDLWVEQICRLFDYLSYCFTTPYNRLTGRQITDWKTD